MCLKISFKFPLACKQFPHLYTYQVVIKMIENHEWITHIAEYERWVNAKFEILYVYNCMH